LASALTKTIPSIVAARKFPVYIAGIFKRESIGIWRGYLQDIILFLGISGRAYEFRAKILIYFF
jgi:hypothetical protein